MSTDTITVTVDLPLDEAEQLAAYSEGMSPENYQGDYKDIAAKVRLGLATKAVLDERRKTLPQVGDIVRIEGYDAGHGWNADTKDTWEGNMGVVTDIASWGTVVVKMLTGDYSGGEGGFDPKFVKVLGKSLDN